MKRVFRWIAIGVGILVVLLIAAPFFIDANTFRPTLESHLSSALGREVKLGNLKLSLLSGGVSADDLSVADDPAFAKAPFLSAKSLSVGVEMMPLILSRKLNVTGLTIDQPEIALIQTPAGDWNFSSLGTTKGAQPATTTAPQTSGKSGLDLSVKLVKITNGRLTMTRTGGHWKPLALDGVNIELHDLSATTEFPFSFDSNVGGGGTIHLDGKAGPLNQTDAAATPMSGNLKVAQLDLARSGWNDWAPDISGVISFDGTGNSDGKTVHFKGQLKADKLKLAKDGTPAKIPVQLDVTANHDFRKHAGAISQGAFKIGKAVANFTGSYAEQGDSMVMHMNLAGPEMPVVELVGMLPPLGIALPLGSSLQGGTAVAKLTMEGAADRLVTSGTLAINNTKLTGFDLGKKMSTIEKLAGIRTSPDTDIQVLSANVRKGPEGMDVTDIKLIVPSIGELDGGGAVSPSNALDFKMSATVHGGGVLAVMGNTSVPFLVEGTATNPVFRPNVEAAVKEKAKDIGGSLLRGLLGGKKKP